MTRIIWLRILVLLIVFNGGLPGCRRVTLVGDSLIGVAQETFVAAINDNSEQSWVDTEHVWSGSTAYNNPINHKIYSEGMEKAFGQPDVVVFSFATNDMFRVTDDQVSMDSAIQAMQTLINQAVISGAMCIVMLESSHRLRGSHPQSARFGMHMDSWFDHWHRSKGDNEYLGLPYTLLMADISGTIAADINKYLGDSIHFNTAGAELAAAAIVEQINHCPQGRWIYGADAMRPDAQIPENPYRQYSVLP
ncbi:MAG: hypothetical protein V7720_07120 [Halioglobus sp.]